MNYLDAKEEISRCTEKIIQNKKVECQWNDELFQASGREEFKKVLLARSEAIRGYFEENEECIKTLRSYMKEPLTEDVALALYESARAMLLSGRMDPGLISEIAIPASRYLRKEKSEDIRTVIATMIKCCCKLDYYNRMLPEYDFEETESDLLWIISHKDRYCEYDDRRVRDNIWISYSNLAMMYIQMHEEEYYHKAVAVYDEAMRLWEREDVQGMDGNDPTTMAIVEDFQFTLPMELGFAVPYDSELIEKVVELQQIYSELYVDDEKWDERIILAMLSIAHEEHRKEITADVALDKLINLMDDIPQMDWIERQDDSQRGLLIFCYLCDLIMRILRNAGMPNYVRESVTIRVLQKFYRMAEDIPYQYQTSYINFVNMERFTEALPNLYNFNIIEQWICQLLIYRQPSTYLHSRMVEQISVEIAKEMLEKAPELFLTLPQYSNVDEIVQDKENLLQLIARGARLHDLGKCSIALIIMQQSRRITDVEFGFIKTHPDLGASYLMEQNDDELEAYRDIIRGHHRTYDGKGGYPCAFDNTSSKYRILIDLITISDATDAATDITGRNYTKGKEFQSLLSELIEGAGSKYNPDIVRIISESPKLIERLSELTGNERISYCYEVYRKVHK